MLRADRRVTSSLWNPLTSGSSEDFNNFNSSEVAQKRDASQLQCSPTFVSVRATHLFQRRTPVLKWRDEQRTAGSRTKAADASRGSAVSVGVFQ
jgi:hypothetical protein